MMRRSCKAAFHQVESLGCDDILIVIIVDIFVLAATLFQRHSSNTTLRLHGGGSFSSMKCTEPSILAFSRRYGDWWVVLPLCHNERNFLVQNSADGMPIDATMDRSQKPEWSPHFCLFHRQNSSRRSASNHQIGSESFERLPPSRVLYTICSTILLKDTP